MSPKYQSDLPSKTEVFDYWKNVFPSKGVFIDWGEPSCWACGHFWNGKYDVTNSKASMQQIYKAWERAPLQRCHIIPRSLGGSSDPSNLYLMCAECHDLAPNTTEPEIFFAWVKRQNWFRRSMSKLNLEFESHGITEEQLTKLKSIFESEEFQVGAQQNIGLHFPQSGYSSIFSRTTLSSILGALLTYAEKHVALGGV
jgi:5-methylcytosine-specific restriction endonuclease McrA